MMNLSRRSILSAIGIALPFGLGERVVASSTPIGNAPVLQFRSFEDGVREAFSVHRNGPGITSRLHVGCGTAR
jgi:hypothetical protein